MIPKFRAFYKPLNKYKRVANLNFDSREQKLVSVTLWNDGDFDEGRPVRSVSVDTVELEQSIGLVDKNGKDIFVGDILKGSYLGPFHRVRVCLEDGRATVITTNFSQISKADLTIGDATIYEVASNIHEEVKNE